MPRQPRPPRAPSRRRCRAASHAAHPSAPTRSWRGQRSACPRIDRARRPVRRGQARRDIGAGTETGIDQPHRPQSVERRGIERQPRRLDTTGPSHVSPSQARSSRIVATCSGRLRVASISSIRSRNRPPPRRARSCARIAETACPRCSRPVGLGAKRVTTAALDRASSRCAVMLMSSPIGDRPNRKPYGEGPCFIPI